MAKQPVQPPSLDPDRKELVGFLHETLTKDVQQYGSFLRQLPSDLLEQFRSQFTDNKFAKEEADKDPIPLHPVFQMLSDEADAYHQQRNEDYKQQLADGVQLRLHSRQQVALQDESTPYLDACSQASKLQVAVLEKLQAHNQRTNEASIMDIIEPTQLISGLAKMIKGYCLNPGILTAFNPLTYYHAIELRMLSDPEFAPWWHQPASVELRKAWDQQFAELILGGRKPVYDLVVRTAHVIIMSFTVKPRTDEAAQQLVAAVKQRLGRDGHDVYDEINIIRKQAQKMLSSMHVGGLLINEDTADPAKLASLQSRTCLDPAQGEDYPYAMIVDLSRGEFSGLTLKEIQWVLLHCCTQTCRWGMRPGRPGANQRCLDCARRAYEHDPSNTVTAYEYIHQLQDVRPLQLEHMLSLCRSLRQRCKDVGDCVNGGRACLMLVRLLLNGADGDNSFDRAEASQAVKEAKAYRPLANNVEAPQMSQTLYKQMHDQVKQGLQMALKKGPVPGKPNRLPCTLLGDMNKYGVGFQNHRFIYSLCTSCGGKYTNMKTCTACGVTKYCSRECQVKDWPQHKQQCQQLREQKDADKGDGSKSVGAGKKQPSPK